MERIGVIIGLVPIHMFILNGKRVLLKKRRNIHTNTKEALLPVIFRMNRFHFAPKFR